MLSKKVIYSDEFKEDEIDQADGGLNSFFGSNVFNDAVMKARLPKNTYVLLKKTIDEGAPLDPSVAEIVANTMKDWAIERGATHYIHWFQPMTGVTAGKNESFISPLGNGKVIMEFSGRELIKGEPDASSFPSGGLRSTFEARGYTAWDCTSPAFLKEDAGGVTLCIPTAFCSYTGEALDEKTPLLRSMEALSKQAIRVLRLFGNTTARKVTSTVGPEQEYFLIDKKLYEKRKDLILTGRTLFGAKPPKGQEMEDHYFANIKERISEYMGELDRELWKLGVPAKTKHNEVAPAQYELATVFTSANVATDHNQIVMETMRRVANRHGLVCLLHEKPFAGVNGSGKHNNWSMSTDEGENLLTPGKTPRANAQFLVFLCAVVKAIDEYQDLIRLSAAIPGNDHRLGANEAPPAIVSVFLGDQLTDILEQIGDGEGVKEKEREILKIGVSTLPAFPKDLTDRNRTSPFAFTGNKFEFRMVPSSGSVALPNIVLNTIVANALSEIADKLEGAENFDDKLTELLKGIVRNHKRIIFNGNGYSDEWIAEAKKRGLLNIRSTVEAIPALLKDKNVKLFEKHGVFSKRELEARYEISLDEYIKVINIEASTMIAMAKRQLLPSAIKYSSVVAQSINEIKKALPSADTKVQERLLDELSDTLSRFYKEIKELEDVTDTAQRSEAGIFERASYYRDVVFTEMSRLRSYADKLETIVDSKYWPLPTYADMLFSI
ncbi:MAG: glutamine synthetase III [Clostridiales bacterium]|nr:glutamine synthetase III [Clostridiales bacterium]